MPFFKTTFFKIITMICCIIVTAITLSCFAWYIRHLLTIDYNWLFELLMVTGMLVFQFPFIYKKPWSLKLNYYYNMLLVSLLGSILLWPLILLNTAYYRNDYLNIIYFFLVVGIMFFDHKRRVAKLSLPAFISYTWVLYRVIILIFII